ncbi:glycosyltransferase, partial [Actinosynnema pretiosum]
MKIAMIALHTGPRSALDAAATRRAGHVADLSSALTALGHDVTVHTGGWASGAPGSVRLAEGYRVLRVPFGGSGNVGDFLADRWRSAPPDVVHAHQWPSGLVALRAAAPLGLPVVQTFHAPSGGHPTGNPAVRRVIGGEAAGIVATSAGEAERLLRTGVRRSKITVVPYGVDIDRFNPGGPCDERFTPRRIVAVGAGHPSDGVGDVVVALRGVPDTELVVVGDPSSDAGQWQRRLANHARVHGVADRVRLVGCVPRSAMASLLRSADAVVCAARTQPFGIVALEAMACGVPVVATSVGVLAEIVVDHVTGVLVPPGSPA